MKRMFQRRPCIGFAVALLLFIATPGSHAGEPLQPAAGSAANPDFAASAKKEFERAREQFLANTNHVEAAWIYARACFDLAEFAANNRDRAKIAEAGIAAARQAISKNPDSAPAHYYLALNLGQLARTRLLTALKLVDQMEFEFRLARQLDERFDHAGPDRGLGLLYSQAPSFGSVGNKARARQHLRRAVDLAPNYPENRLNLLEAYLAWGDTAAAARELKALQAMWPEAKKEFAGEEWALSWSDWEKRLSAARRQLKQDTDTATPPAGSTHAPR